MFTTFTKRTGIFFALLALLSISFTSCKKDEHIVNVPANPNQTVLKEIVLKLGARYSGPFGTGYLVEDKISNVKVKINGVNWGTYDSKVLDKSLYTTKDRGGFNVSSEIAYYTVTIPAIKTSDEIAANSQLSKLLNSSNTLYPGAYFYSIESFDVTNIKGETTTVKVNDERSFTVLENHRSVYLGSNYYSFK